MNQDLQREILQGVADLLPHSYFKGERKTKSPLGMSSRVLEFLFGMADEPFQCGIVIKGHYILVAGFSGRTYKVPLADPNCFKLASDAVLEKLRERNGVEKLTQPAR